MNLAAIDTLARSHKNLDIVFVESGGDNLSATFSPEFRPLKIGSILKGEKPVSAAHGNVA